jgi:hypothetical protein
MGGLRHHRLVVLGLVLALLATVLGVAAGVDHRRKQERIDVASVPAWYCANRGRMCDREKPADIERRWVERERWYTAGALALLIAAPLGLFAVGRR